MKPGFRNIKSRQIQWLSVVVLASFCTVAFGAAKHDDLYGKAEPRERKVTTLPANTIDYWSQVKPIVETRCVVCHGCFDAPCQLKMSSIEGIERGASEAEVYDESRSHEAPLTRLFEDAQTVAEWRAKGFTPVLNEHDDTSEANREAGVMYRMLQLKQQNPLPAATLLPKSFDLGLKRKQVCTAPEKFDKYEKKHPLWGMPYALPGLESGEQDILTSWIEQGASYTKRAPLPDEYAALIESWEQFLNDSSLKQQLASRYIYEHLSFGHLYFPAAEELHFFSLVRSATPPGQPIQIIATRRPYDPPGVDRVYFRLQEIVSTIVEKQHMPYALDDNRMQRWQELFVDADYTVTKLPSHDPMTASNPFVTFADLPVDSRYRFMLDEAEFTIMTFIKGPVCRSSVAIDVIDDNFWVFFVDPDKKGVDKLGEFLAGEAQSLQMPAATRGGLQKQWKIYKQQQTEFLARKDKFLEDNAKPSLETIWDGNGTNQNASLTVYRNFDSATIDKGMLGGAPKTAWVIDYTLLERIQYLLVVDYDVYGNLTHQLNTRRYMDFLRMEGEANFLALLPEAARAKERAFWYRDAKSKVMEYVSSPTFEAKVEPDIDYKTDDPKQELYAMLRTRLADVLPTTHEMASVQNATIRSQMDRLTKLVGPPATLLSETTFLQVNTSSGSEHFTLLRNSAYSNMTAILSASKFRLPAEDTVAVMPGFVGAYPNTFLLVDEADLSKLVDAISQLQTDSDYTSLMDNYGIRRTNADFWKHSDGLHQAFKAADPVVYGTLDYARLENRGWHNFVGAARCRSHISSRD